MIYLSESGFQTKLNEVPTNLKVICLLGICDSVARPMLQNFTQFNGQYGCSICYDMGTVLSDRPGTARIYPYNSRSNLQCHSQTEEFAMRAQNTGIPEKGIKGVSIFSKLPYFDIVQNFPPEYMHSLLLGVVRRTANLWFNSKNHKQGFYLKQHECSISKHLLKIKPPCCFSRTPWPLSERKFWKAHEWLNWLLYYSPILLKQFLGEEYYVHWNLLVCSIAYLINTVSKQKTKIASRLLVNFVLDYSNLYGSHNMTFNVHLCLHLVKV